MNHEYPTAIDSLERAEDPMESRIQDSTTIQFPKPSFSGDACDKAGESSLPAQDYHGSLVSPVIE
jgi:hypothetical protein